MKKQVLMIIIGILAISLIGCTSSKKNDSNSTNKNDTSVTPKNNTDKSNNKKSVTAKEASDIAIKKAGGGEVIKSKLDYDDGESIYDIEVINGDNKYDIEIVESTGEIVNFEESPIRSKSNSNKVNVSISAEKAEEIALEKVGGGEIIKSKLDYDDGISMYEIEIINGDFEYSVSVDSETGDIIDFEKDKRELFD